MKKKQPENTLSALYRLRGYLKIEKRVPFDSTWNAFPDGCVEVGIHPYWQQELNEIWWHLYVAMYDDEGFDYVWPDLEPLLDIYNKIECGVTREFLEKLGMEHY